MLSVQSFSTLIAQVLPEPHAGLLSGILFGVKIAIAPELKDALVTTGTLHIVALSGTNITILTSMINVALLWLFPRKVAAVVTILTIVGFVLFVGPSPSVVRAAIMGSVVLVSVLTGKTVVGIVSWLVAAGSMLCIQLNLVTDLSFQLSVLASLGLVVFSEKKVLKVSNASNVSASLMRLLKSELHTTLAAQVFTIPLLLVVFHRISFISPFTNLLIGWTVPVITGLGMILCLIGIVWIPFAQIVAWFIWVFLEYLIFAIMWTSTLPGASVGG